MYKALVSFSGAISMAKGQVADIKNEEVVKDLLNAGYIEKVKETEPKEKVEETENTKKKKK